MIQDHQNNPMLDAKLMTQRGNGQSVMPEVLENGTLNEQMDYIEQRTRIYENYRAIREDLFQKIKQNAIDSLMSSKAEIASLIYHSKNQNRNANIKLSSASHR